MSTCTDTGTTELKTTPLVEESLASCAHVVPSLRSIYRWNDAVNFDELVVALPAADGHHAHLEWVSSSTRTPQP